MSSQALATITPMTMIDPHKRDELLRNLILPKATPEQITLALAICERYGFDPLLKHILFIGGNLYVTRDALRHLANSHPMFDGYGRPEFEQDKLGKWIVTVSVFRKDRQHPFYATAYETESSNPQSQPWQRYPRLMTHKVAEVMALRAAFSVSLGTAEELAYDGQTTVLGPAHSFTPRSEPQPTTVRVLPTQSQSTIVDVAAEGLDATEFQTLRDTLSQMSFDGLAEVEMVAFVKSQKEILSPDQLNQLRRDYKRLVDGRTESAAPQAIIVDATPAIVTSAPTLDLAEGDKPAKPAHLEAIKSLCAMKAIPLAEALAKAGATDLAALTQPEARTVIDWLQHEMPREAVTA